MAGRSPRHLVLKALSTVVKADVPDPTDINDGVKNLDPGHMQLYNFFVPGLLAGEYTIKVSQHVALDGTAMDLDMRGPNKEATQNFHVLGPQFVIPPNDFHSTYPPQGLADQPNIAPHIVFNDPHLPWERAVLDNETDHDNVTPWLALFPFDCNNPTNPELRLSNTQLSQVQTALGQSSLKPGPTFSFTSTVQTFVSLPKPPQQHQPGVARTTPQIWIPDYSQDDLYNTMLTDDTPVEIIFLQGSLFRKLFCPKDAIDTPDIGQFRYCAHVRNINTTGITDAGTSDTGLFSVIHSKRSGPTDVAQGAAPRSQAVHLFSLEYVDALAANASTQFKILDDDLIGFVSLYRWTYLCQPPLTVNFIDTMRDIGIQMKWSQGTTLDANELTDFNAHIQDTPPNAYLRCPPSALSAIELPTLALKDTNPMKSIGQRMVQRLKDGYSLTRYRVQSGEETVALFRGALLPVYPQAPIASWPVSSTNGQDYQILDKTLGIMDISYSTAWQLGRLMASSDMGFVSALLRIRTRAYQSGVVSSDYLSAHDTIDFKTQQQFFTSLPNTLDILKQVSAMGGAPSIALRARWDRSSRSIDQSLNPHAFTVGVKNQIQIEGSAAGTDGLVPVQDLLPPTSVDWKFVHDWLLDRMFLAGIPTHYLIADPSLLPPESIRFFHIDNNWMDCFIDGALSVANHSSLTNQDVVREEIKEQFNLYLRTPVMVDPLNPKSGQLHNPQIPTYGLFLRSAVVAAFQDLIIEVPYTDDTTRAGRAPILVQKRLGPDILMILLDRRPDTGAIPSIKFRQPPHQQRFCAADYLSQDEATYLFRKIALTGIPSMEQFGPDVRFSPKDGAASVFDWDSRCIDFKNLQSLLFDKTFLKGIYSDLPGYFVDDTNWKNAPHHLTSSLVGIQLNDSMKYLEIIPPATNNPKPPNTFSGGPYQIRTTLTSAAIAKAKSFLAAAKSKKSTPVSLAKPSNPSPIVTPPQRLHTIPPSFTLKALAAHANIHPTPTPSIRHALATSPSPQMARSAFNYRLYPREAHYADSLDSTRPQTHGYVYQDARSLVDLIFSVVINHTVADSVPSAGLIRLRTIELSIPLGPSTGRPLSPTPGLAPMGIGGVRVRMLSNQRWAVVVDPSTTFLTVRLVPRSMNLCEGFNVCQELGFLLSGLDTGWMADGTGKEVNNGNDSVVIVREVYGQTVHEEQGSVGNSIRVRRKIGWVPFADTT